MLYRWYRTYIKGENVSICYLGKMQEIYFIFTLKEKFHNLKECHTYGTNNFVLAYLVWRLVNSHTITFTNIN